MARAATATQGFRPPVAVESVRADEVRVTDEVWFQDWTREFVGGPVRSVAWEGEDVEVTFRADFGKMGDTVRFTTSPGNGVFVRVR